MRIITFETLKKECEKQHCTIYEIAQKEESMESDCSVTKVRFKVRQHLEAMSQTIKSGMQSSEKAISNWCGDDCQKLQDRYKHTNAMFGPLFEKIVTYSLATIEENLRMGKVVACPTAGSCGIVPAVIIAVAEEYDLTEKIKTDALITAGEIGAIISHKVRLAGD